MKRTLINTSRGTKCMKFAAAMTDKLLSHSWRFFRMTTTAQQMNCNGFKERQRAK